MVRDPDAIGAERRRQTARTSGRDQLERRHAQLRRVSPRVGELDEAAAAAYVEEDPDAALALLADLAHATDRQVRAAARRLAQRLALRPPPGLRAASGRARLATSADPDGADLDLDATLARLDHAPRLRRTDVRTRDWERRGSAYVLLVDVSGSVDGARLATGVLAAGAVAAALRPADELAVVAFGSDALVLRAADSPAAPASVLEPLLDLRGSGTTDLAHGLVAALGEARRARSQRREVLLLTDGLRTAGDDPLPVAASAGRDGARVHVLGLDADHASVTACRALADAGGGQYAALPGPAAAAPALRTVLAVD